MNLNITIPEYTQEVINECEYNYLISQQMNLLADKIQVIAITCIIIGVLFGAIIPVVIKKTMVKKK